MNRYRDKKLSVSETLVCPVKYFVNNKSVAPCGKPIVMINIAATINSKYSDRKKPNTPNTRQITVEDMIKMLDDIFKLSLTIFLFCLYQLFHIKFYEPLNMSYKN